MKHLLLSITFMVILTGCQSDWQRCPEVVETEGIIAAGAELVEVSTQFSFTEGPAADSAGNVYFTDQPNDRIMIYTTSGRVERFMKPSGRANGLYFAPDGTLIACADENNELRRINVHSRQHTMLARKYEDTRLNAPNDAWVHPSGAIYFTDPFYKRPWWRHTDQPQDVCGVYRLSADESTMIRIVDDLVKPNGIIGTPDGKNLYVADIKDKKIYSYDIDKDGRLANRKLFCEHPSDGMTLDCCGNVYITNKNGVMVFNPAGEQIEQIKVPQSWTANVTFGGADGKMLFITARSGIYTLQMNVAGAQYMQ
ncbi:MAG: SMP-30/gluconolactonase/LRE family protein [Planctomycetota bacterium]|jgi:gluconolactonase